MQSSTGTSTVIELSYLRMNKFGLYQQHDSTQNPAYQFEFALVFSAAFSSEAFLRPVRKIHRFDHSTLSCFKSATHFYNNFEYIDCDWGGLLESIPSHLPRSSHSSRSNFQCKVLRNCKLYRLLWLQKNGRLAQAVLNALSMRFCQSDIRLLRFCSS